MEIIRVDNLTVQYENTVVLQDISFAVELGDYIAVVGPNGAGKTTLVKTMLGIVEKSGGSVFFKSDRTGYLQQKVSLNDPKFPANVREIVQSGLLANKKFPKIYTGEDHRKTESMIDRLGIRGLAKKLVGKLSGGELQKVLLARALIGEPEVLFLDEPTTALDPNSREAFYRLLQDLNEQSHITILLISHDIGSVGRYAKKMLYIDQSVVFYGTFGEFCSSPDITRYFGEASQHLFCGRHH